MAADAAFLLRLPGRLGDGPEQRDGREAEGDEPRSDRQSHSGDVLPLHEAERDIGCNREQ